MEMIEDAEELLDRPVTDETIRSGLREVRKLWNAGLAHRDIKPSNVLVKGEDVYLIDVAFGEARPSPWREAVDLANMMLVMGLGAEPERVYRIATEVFTQDEIAEAFAATQRVTVPSQSRQMLKKDRRELVTRFRKLAPARAPVSIQRWSYRRLSLTVAVMVCVFIAGGLVTSNLRGAGLTTPPEATQGSFALVVREPFCHNVMGLDAMGLMAQSVPSAAFIPCTTPASQGWEFHGMDVRSGRTKIFFDAVPEFASPERHELVVVMKSTCPARGEEVASGDPRIRRLEDSDPAPASFTGVRRFIFEGGCIEYRFDLEGDDWPNFVSASSLALDFRSRASLNAEIQRRLGWGEEEML
jgi:serine/threonine protein kinase